MNVIVFAAALIFLAGWAGICVGGVRGFEDWIDGR